MSQLTPSKRSTANTSVTKNASQRRFVPTVLTRSIMLTCLFLYTWPAVRCQEDPTTMDLSVALAGHPRYTKLVQAFVSNNLIQQLISNGQPLTVLAPTNAAFNALPKAEAKSIEKQNTGSYVLRYHILTKYYTYSELYAFNGSKVESVAGPNIIVTGGLPGGRIKFVTQDGALSHLEQADVVANGHLSVQGVSSILIPLGFGPPAPHSDPTFKTSAPISAPKTTSEEPPATDPLVTSPPTVDNLAPPYPPPSHPRHPKNPFLKYPPPSHLPPSPSPSPGAPVDAANTLVKSPQPSIVTPPLSPPGTSNGTKGAEASAVSGAGMRTVPLSGFVALILGACIAYL